MKIIDLHLVFVPFFYLSLSLSLCLFLFLCFFFTKFSASSHKNGKDRWPLIRSSGVTVKSKRTLVRVKLNRVTNYEWIIHGTVKYPADILRIIPASSQTFENFIKPIAIPVNQIWISPREIGSDWSTHWNYLLCNPVVRIWRIEQN